MKAKCFYPLVYYKEYWLFHFHDWKIGYGGTIGYVPSGEILLDKEASMKE